VPQQILSRKKVGFPVPYALWLKGDLKDWLADILLSRRSLERGYFRRPLIEQMVSENVRTGGYSKEMFSLASLELLQQVFVDGGVLTSESTSCVAPATSGRRAELSLGASGYPGSLSSRSQVI
jgi:hypothetical protein